jgi:RNA polymerase sigma factor (TIGR02999 family)
MVRDFEDFSRMTPPDERGRPQAKQPAAELIPILYAELRRLAAVLTTRLPHGQTLQPTALVHEAYLRLVRDEQSGWEGRRHFFGAAAKAMREILIEQARHKRSLKQGGQAQRVELPRAWPGSNRRPAISSPWTRRSSSSRRKTRISRKSSCSAITPG